MRTACGSTPSPRCSTSTTPRASPASGFRTATAVARTSRRSRSSGAERGRARDAPGRGDDGRGVDGVAGRLQADRVGPRLHLQVEHGLDARHARLRVPRACPPALAPRRAHVLDGVRGTRTSSFRSPRRGRSRQGRLLRKLPGDEWQQFATLRALYAHTWGHPESRLLFMGGELGQGRRVGGRVARLVRARLPAAPRRPALRRRPQPRYRAEPALWQVDFAPDGFQWLVGDAREDNVLARSAFSADGSRVPASSTSRRSSATTGECRCRWVGAGARWWNTDAAEYGGSGVGNLGGVAAVAEPMHGRPFSAGGPCRRWRRCGSRRGVTRAATGARHRSLSRANDAECVCQLVHRPAGVGNSGSDRRSPKSGRTHVPEQPSDGERVRHRPARSRQYPRRVMRRQQHRRGGPRPRVQEGPARRRRDRPPRRTRRDLRLPGPERRREVDHRADADHPAAADIRRCPCRRLRRRARAKGALDDRRRAPGGCARRAAHGATTCACRRCSRGCRSGDRQSRTELLERVGLTEAADCKVGLLGRHEAKARPALALVHRPRAVPRRADHRARPAEPHGALGRGRAALARRRRHGVPHDAVPRGGRRSPIGSGSSRAGSSPRARRPP